MVRRRQRRLRCGAPRRRRRRAPSPTSFHPAPQHRIAQAKFLGHRPDRAAARSHQIDRLPLIVLRKRPALTSFHPTPPGSSSLLQVSINSEEVHFDALLKGRLEDDLQLRITQELIGYAKSPI